MPYHVIPTYPDYEINDENGEVRNVKTGHVMSTFRSGNSVRLQVRLPVGTRAISLLAMETFVGPVVKEQKKLQGRRNLPTRESCVYGHDLTDKKNIRRYKRPDGYWEFRCRTCSSLRVKARRRGMKFPEYMAYLKDRGVAV